MNRFTGAVLTGLLGSVPIVGDGASAQQTSRSVTAQARTSAIVASFNKSKHAVKERYGVRVEKYKEVRSEPVIKGDLIDYAGYYEVAGMRFSLTLQVDAKGNVTATGDEPVDFDAPLRRRFTLRNARIEGALLTATKVYASGVTEPFEGVFINRTSFDSPRARGIATFGLGVIASSVRVANGVYVDRFFYERRR